MVAGHLSVKHGNYYAVLNYKNSEGKRKTKWISLVFLLSLIASEYDIAAFVSQK